MDIGSLVQNLIGKWKKRLGKAIYTSTVVACLICLTWQLNMSTLKFLAKGTGADINYEPTMTTVNLSFTLCKSVQHYDVPANITTLVAVQYKLESDDPDWVTYSDSNASFTFLWYENDMRHICQSFPILGKLTQVLHKFGISTVANSKNMKVYLHESGVFSSPHRIKMRQEWYYVNSLFEVTAEQINQINEEGSCKAGAAGQFDNCKFNYLTAHVNQTAGCVLQHMR